LMFSEVVVKAASDIQAGASAMARKMDLGHLPVVQVGLEDLLVEVCQQAVVATAGTSSEKALVGTTTPENTSDPVISLPR
jgi:hypothetical protein